MYEFGVVLALVEGRPVHCFFSSRVLHFQMLTSGTLWLLTDTFGEARVRVVCRRLRRLLLEEVVEDQAALGLVDLAGIGVG